MACRGPDSLPEDLDGLIHYAWSDWEDASDADLLELAGRLDGVVSDEELSEILEGSLSPLSLEDVQAVGIERDPAGAQGLLMARDFACDFGRLEEILIDVEQDELYEGSYDRYERSYTTDVDAWTQGESNQVEWEVEYDANLLGTEYTASVIGGMRRVRGLPADVSECGTALLGRFYLPEPAEFDEGSSKTLDFNFQVEIFYEAEPGRIVHFYATWQQSEIGAGLTSDTDGVQSVILTSMADWDSQTEKLCAQ